MSAALLRGEQRMVDLIQANGSTITFTSPLEVTATAKANIGQSEFEEGSIGGAVASLTIVKSHDFIVPVEDLPSGFDVTTARGWKITFNSNTYRPTTFQEQPPIVDSGRFGLMKRIHTRQVS